MVRNMTAKKEKIVGEYLKSLGVPPNLYGYEALCLAIGYILDHPNVRLSANNLYAVVGSLTEGNWSRAERNIRHAILYAFDKTHPQKLQDLFENMLDYESCKVTNMTFIYTVADAIRGDWPIK